MNRPEQIVQKLYQSGEVTYAEAAAILHAVKIAQELATAPRQSLTQEEVEGFKKLAGSETWELWQKWAKDNTPVWPDSRPDSRLDSRLD